MVKYRKEIIVILMISFIIFFLKAVNVLQIENGLGKPYSIIILIIFFSFISIVVQKRIDHNYDSKSINLQNLDILKYICSILIIILHLRPFLNYYNQLDLAFNNIVTRICVPIFFMITGYFVSKKEKNNINYIKEYIKKMIPLYLTWSIIYLIIIIVVAIVFLPSIINSYLIQINIPLPLILLLLVILIPLTIIVALFYTGTYYHLWYFPAVILSLLVLLKWKKKFNPKILLYISFFLLLFGATETYYGMLPLNIKELISFYYNIFFTTRNFLFFGLFYVVLGYVMGNRKELYSKYCFEKLAISFLMLIFEALILQNTDRLDSNILLSCVPLTYYLFICSVYITEEKKNEKWKKDLRNFSKYYYLIHPFVILVLSLTGIITKNTKPYIQILVVIIITHIISQIIIKVKQKKIKITL